ncbi:MAG: hypothetical protein ACXAEU_11080 [Candidatus Hodarchaeales archaeon]
MLNLVFFYIYDIATRTTTQITDNEISDYEPKIHGGQVVWTARDFDIKDDWEIFHQNTVTGTTTQLTHNNFGIQIYTFTLIFAIGEYSFFVSDWIKVIP